eukprot:TRINITY_DN5955_c0_g1_i6.p1 TRINITY_DN5955_c0_g1~~TRINITY_DN5955_c0_g1_i6.p1  ORF type:complete len:337 (-),score=37.22 TRINITY_DN5955_c0_g1_i6:60-1070(-)
MGLLQQLKLIHNTMNTTLWVWTPLLLFLFNAHAQTYQQYLSIPLLVFYFLLPFIIASLKHLDNKFIQQHTHQAIVIAACLKLFAGGLALSCFFYDLILVKTVPLSSPLWRTVLIACVMSSTDIGVSLLRYAKSEYEANNFRNYSRWPTFCTSLRCVEIQILFIIPFASEILEKHTRIDTYLVIANFLMWSLHAWFCIDQLTSRLTCLERRRQRIKNRLPRLFDMITWIARFLSVLVAPLVFYIFFWRLTEYRAKFPFATFAFELVIWNMMFELQLAIAAAIFDFWNTPTGIRLLTWLGVIKKKRPELSESMVGITEHLVNERDDLKKKKENRFSNR